MMVSKISILKEKNLNKILVHNNTPARATFAADNNCYWGMGPSGIPIESVCDWRVVHARSSARGKAAPKEGSEGS